MSNPLHADPEFGEPPYEESIEGSSDSEGDVSDSDDESDDGAINDVESLRKGIIKTSRNEAKAPYTILLVGETGTGKSSALEFIANVLIGKGVDCYDFNILDHSNEQGGSSGQSQTNSARIYELSSKNDILVRIVDAPGLADTRGLDRDEHHKRSIATEIQQHIASVNAVLILANGAVPRLTVGTNYALAALSALFPRTLAQNIAFIFSNVPTLLSVNLPRDAIPEALKSAPQFSINNPIALQRKFLKSMDDSIKETEREEMQVEVRRAEKNALKMLVKLFDWLDNLEPQPTRGIVALYEKSQAIETKITNTLAQMNRASAQMAEIKKLVEELQIKSADVDAFSKFERMIDALVWKQQPAPTLNYLCNTPDCHSTCGVEHSLAGVILLFPMQLSLCSECNHPHLSHFHLRSTWKQVHEAQVSVDDNMRRQWEAAKDEEGRTQALIETSESALGDLSGIIDDAMDELARLAEEYARLSLSGSFSAPLEKAIWLLEQQCRGMEEKGVDREMLGKVRGRLDEMRRRLDLLGRVKEKGIRRIERKGRVPKPHRVPSTEDLDPPLPVIRAIRGGVRNIFGTLMERVTSRLKG